DPVRIALHEVDAAERHAQPRRQHLRESRRVSLAVVERAADERDLLVALEADAAHLLVRRRGDFHVAADPEAPELAARFRLVFSFGKTFNVARRERLLEDGAEIAALHRHLRRVLVLNLRGLDMFAAPSIDAFDAHLA